MIVTTSAIDETLLVTIDRPPVNALDLDAIAALEQVFAAATREVPSGGVVVTGRGQVFSAGVDTRAFAGYSRDQRRAMVGAINGHALGGGFVLRSKPRTTSGRVTTGLQRTSRLQSSG